MKKPPKTKERKNVKKIWIFARIFVILHHKWQKIAHYIGFCPTSSTA